jgi:Cu-Zn family superoxide dismutase
MRSLITGLTACLLTAGAAAAQSPAVVQATIVNNDGKQIGTLSVQGGKSATVLRLAIGAGGLAPGWHAMHFHAVGDCSDTAKFEASKAHVNHAGKKHGLLNPEGPDEGDLPNLYAGADGSANAEASTRTLLEGAQGLRDGDGSALILHANADDHQSQPIGGAGARVGCAAIK